MQRFITWETIELRVDGARIEELAQTMKVPPIERLALRFSNGLLRVEGTIRKVIAVPFSVDIAEILAEGTTVRVPIRGAAAFGAIPIPQFLFTIVQAKLPKDLIGFEPPATFVVSLDRFLPSFLSADVRKIWIIDGGLQVTLGRGGADLPPGALDGK
jgi:hypothetical protein